VYNFLAVYQTYVGYLHHFLVCKLELKHIYMKLE